MSNRRWTTFPVKVFISSHTIPPVYVLSSTNSGNYANNTHILGRNQQSAQFRVQDSHLFLCTAAGAAAEAASQPIINSAVYFSSTVRLLSSIKLVDEPKDRHHSSEGIQHREPTPVLSLSTPALCCQLLMWQEKCEHGLGKLHLSSPSSPRAGQGKLAHSFNSCSPSSCRGLTPCTSESSQRF